jgi:two-component system OmpR family response regulator
MRLLIIEDDKEIASYIAKGMKQSGHNPDICYDGKEGLFLATTENYDLIITDRMLPELDGLTLIKTIRGAGNKCPVIILSSLGDVDDRITGLRSGSDDYLVKPFSFEELLARAEILEKRSKQISNVQRTIKIEDAEIDLLSRKVKRGSSKIDLNSREFLLFEFLLKHRGQVVTRIMLLENVWDYHFDPQTNVIDVHISRLRNKIDKGFEKQIIKTVRGAGYIIE